MSSNQTQVIPPPPAAPSSPLRRSTGDRLVAGVCGGLGRRYGIDPVILRVVFVVAVLAGGVGLFAYLALWLLLPADTDRTAEPLTRNLVALVVGVLVAVVAAMAGIGWLGSLGGFTGVVVGAFIVGLVIWLYQNNRSQGPLPRPVAMSTSAPSPDWAPPAGFAYGGYGQPAPAGGPAGAALAPAPRERSYLGLITLLAAVVVGAALTALSAAGLVPLSAVGVMAATLAVLAVGLVVGAFVGRARWLVILALPLALVLGVTAQVAALIPTTMPAGVGDRTWNPTAAGEYRLGVGDATMDLTSWGARPAALQPHGQTVTASVGVGQLEVLVPRGWQATVTARTGLGEITVNGDRVPQPQGETTTISLPAIGAATGQVRLDLDAEIGSIAIRQVAVAPAAGSPGPARERAPARSQPAPTSAATPRDATPNGTTPNDAIKENSR